MALLTAAERDELKKEGLYVREKCDNCKKPILTPVSYIKGKEVWCPKCAKGQDLTAAHITTNVKKEKEMAKAKVEKKEKKETSKIAGHLVEGTAIADLYQFLEDEKVHKLNDAKKLLAKHKADPMGRIYQLGRYGKKFNAWGLIVDTEDGTIQMKVGKGAASAAKKSSAKAEKSSKKSSEKEEGASSKGLKMVATLIRHTLKSGKNWTKAKMLKYLDKEADVDKKVAQAALKHEIREGGITLEDGVLQLA